MEDPESDSGAVTNVERSELLSVWEVKAVSNSSSGLSESASCDSLFYVSGWIEVEMKRGKLVLSVDLVKI